MASAVCRSRKGLVEGTFNKIILLAVVAALIILLILMARRAGTWLQ